MRISDGSADVCSSDLVQRVEVGLVVQVVPLARADAVHELRRGKAGSRGHGQHGAGVRVEHHRRTDLGHVRQVGARRRALRRPAQCLLKGLLGDGLDVHVEVEDDVVAGYGSVLSDDAHRVAVGVHLDLAGAGMTAQRSEEHTSELQSLMRISYAVFCLKKKKYQLYT